MLSIGAVSRGEIVEGLIGRHSARFHHLSVKGGLDIGVVRWSVVAESV